MTQTKIDPLLVSTDKDITKDKSNRLLLEWLSDDDDRAALFGLVNKTCSGALRFPSRDTGLRECDCEGFDRPHKPPRFEHRWVTLITDRAAIQAVLRDNGTHYSNRIYAELGGGSFMLALDPKAALAHAEQREAFRTCFPESREQLRKLSHLACQAASITALRAPEFDLANFAEQCALRFCQKMLGFALSDYRLLETTLRAAYWALVYQVMGRHFVSDPVAIPAAKQEMAKLLKRTSALIDAYAAKDEDALKGCTDRSVPEDLTPALKKLGELPSKLNGEQRAIVAVGAAIGTMGNVQAAACIAVKALFEDKKRWEQGAACGPDGPSLWAKARLLAGQTPVAWPLTCTQLDAWKALLEGSLRKNPPIPFLPRLRVDQHGNADGEVILALGGGTLDGPAYDALIWGGLPDVGTHNCLGKELAWPLIVEIVRQVMALPGLAERLDPEDATVIGLKKRWGFVCESYPLTHRRDGRVTQASLNVAMRLKAPVKDSADLVREVIRSGAPRIEEALRDARHVHFAWFELIESDTVLVLHTVYDGPFDAYIQDFALKVGDLFDLLFKCIENPPPMPVDKFPNEFVAHIQRNNRAPTMGYFFSAYPRSDVARIIRDELARP